MHIAKFAACSTIATTLCAASLLGLAGAAQAQKPSGLPNNYPSKPVRVIVGSAAGGGADNVARMISAKMTEAWGNPFLVENISSGIGGILALQQIHKSAPDGYTISNSSGSTIQNAHFQNKVSFDVRKDLKPIVQTTIAPQYMAFYPKAPFTTLKEMVAYAKANPGKVTFGTSGVGSGSHLLGEYIADLTGIQLQHIPYKGAGQSTVDAIGGRIMIVFGSQPAITPHVNRGTLRPVGISTAKRMPLQPDTPTIAEQGLPGLDYTSWQGWLGVSGIPDPIVRALNLGVNKAIQEPELMKILLAEGANPVNLTPEEFGKNINDALSLVDGILKKTGIKLTD